MVRGAGAVLLLVSACGRVGFDAVADDSRADACPTCDVGLIAYWRLDETTGTVAADSIGGHDGTVFAATDWRPAAGIRGGAVSLDETYVEVPWDAGSQISTAFTVALWVRLSTRRYMYDRYFAQFYFDGTDHGMLMLDSDLSAGGLRCATHTDQFAYVTHDSGVDVDRWTHVACTYDGAQLVEYIDGVSVASSPLTGLVTPTEAMPLVIGGSRWGTLSENEANGLFDDVRLYARALDASELASLATP